MINSKMDEGRSVLNKLQKTQIKFKKFIKETPPLEVCDVLLLCIAYISLLIFTIGLCCIPILPILCNTYPTLGVKFFHILFEKVISPSGGTALVTVFLSDIIHIYITYFDEQLKKVK